MAINVAILSKLKPVQLNSLKKGKSKLDIGEPVSALQGKFMKALQAISTSLDGDPDNAKGTQVSMLIISNCITMSDTKPQQALLFIPPSKEPQFKLKTICKIPEVKKSKEIGICQIVAVGTKEDDLHLFDLHRRGGRLKITPKLLTELNKMGKKKGLKFRKPVEEGEEESSAPSPETTTVAEEPKKENDLFAAIKGRLEEAKQNFEAGPNPATLKLWEMNMVKLKKQVQIVAKQKPAKTAEAKELFMSWNKEFAAAKKQLAGNAAPKKKDEGIDAKLQALSDQKDAMKKKPSIEGIMALLSQSQQLRVSPAAKSAFKKDPEALKKFKALRKSISELLKDDMKAELALNLENPEIVKNDLKREISNVWRDFVDDATNAETFDIIADTVVVKLLQDIKGFQKSIAVKAQGLIEASKMMDIGDATEVSKNMTEVRSSLSKLKQHAEAKYKEIKASAEKMATLAKQCLESKDSEEQEQLIDQIEKIANSLEWSSTWTNFSYN